MSVRYNVVERGNPSNLQAPKKFYPSIQSSGRVSQREMAEMAAQRSTLSTMDMMAAIESFLAIIPEQLAKGNIVELGDFGSFWLRTESTGPPPPKRCILRRSPAFCRASTRARSSSTSWTASSSSEGR